MSTNNLAHHRQMMASPSLWPLFPVLPLVRPRADGGLDLGVLICYECVGSSRVTTVVRANLLLLPSSPEALLSLPSEVFPSFDAMLAAGWRVD